ncbi:MAG TPA: hypothetical protein VG013_21425 [Gemmataceae bacterium]|jgi:hypothetical protein|nr:hypothetical protein [Gemmataceae bacterium]
MSEQALPELETDPRFPSGPWTGFFLQRLVPGRHMMELRLTFSSGHMLGEGRDWVGPFVIQGRYHLEDGRCGWVKHYLGKHDVQCNGFNEGKGIWGVWEIPGTSASPSQRGGFHIWPEGMPDPSRPQLTEAADLPAPAEEESTVDEPVLAPAP